MTQGRGTYKMTYFGEIEIETESGLQYSMIIRAMMEGMRNHNLSQQQSMGYAIATLKDEKEIPQVKIGHCVHVLRTQHQISN